VGATVLLIIALRGRGGIELRLRSESIDWPLLARILRIGLPGGFDLLTVITCHLFYASIINSLGTMVQAAHGLGVQIEALSYLSGSAFQVAAATMTGQSLGAQNSPRAVRSTLVATGLAMVIMSTAGVIFFVFGQQLAQLFTKETTETTVLTGQLLKIVAISCPFLAVLQVVSGALRGAGDTTWPFLCTLAGLTLVRLPGAAWLAWTEIPLPFTDLVIPGWGWGVHGAWMAMVADVALRSVLISFRFASGHWRHVRV
jgi:Na+-driven multidrug efflux pump